MPNEGEYATEELKSRMTYTYDVFLSFSEKDTRCTFTGNLFNALRHKRIKAFFPDDELHNSGDQLSPSILKAIQESRISIVVLSENYASSTLCLDKLVNILECMRMNNQLVWPIFYKGFKTFMDDEGLEGGNQISKTLLETIEKSKLSIVVFSENYGYSLWCLDELVKIIECMKIKNQLVLPIFYKVEQSDVSNLTKSHGHAMTRHENKFGKDSEKVQKWRSALSEVAYLKGEYIKENEFEYESIKNIVEMANVGNHP